MREIEVRQLKGPNRAELRPIGIDTSLFGCALILLEDGCPPEQDCHLCAMQEDDDGSSCKLCWSKYLFYVANGRDRHPYQREWIYEGGMLGA